MKLRPLYFFLLCLLSGSACSKEDEVMPSPSDVSPCMQERTTIETIEDTEGILTSEAGLLLIEVMNSNEVLAPCNLPGTFQENDQVLFSGNKKEILPNERWAGHPFELTRIEKQSEGEEGK